jgi:hypothetical protein
VSGGSRTMQMQGFAGSSGGEIEQPCQ